MLIQVNRGDAIFLRRHLLVFVCSKSGKGKGEQLFKKHVQPLFEMAEINVTVTVTGKEPYYCVQMKTS